MKILLIGGNGFIGRYVVERLASCGHELMLFHRGSKPSEPARFAREMLGDANHLSEYRAQLSALAPDVVINFILSTGAQAEEMMSALHGIAGRLETKRGRPELIDFKNSSSRSFLSLSF